MNKAIQSLTDKGLKPTQRNVVIETGLSIETVKRHWKHRVQVTIQSDIEKFKARVSSTTVIIVPTNLGLVKLL